ncbi:hypothetical protein [Roseateles sp.]|nr:hypothetical protein [Roseateles sp.]
MKEKLMFAAEVLIVFAVTKAFQMHVFKLPVVGDYLPGGSTKATAAA